jgi:glycosyltransferase involved in cell wall biosynthesis
VSKNNQKPFFSIITVVYNGKKYLKETIKSVINQDFRDFEYIIIDGGSTDGTVDIIKKYEKHIDKWVSEKDEGIYNAMNKGLRLAKGQVVNMMNCGDFFENKEVLRKVFNCFKNDKELGFVLGRSRFIENDGKDYCISKNKKVVSSLWAGRFNTISHQAFFVKKNLHNKFGFYDESYKLAADGRFMYDLYHNKKIKKKILDGILSVRRAEGAGSSIETLLEHKRMYDEVFGKSFVNNLLIFKYHLKKNKLGRFFYKIYARLKNLIWSPK